MSIFHGELIRFGFRQMIRSKKTWAAAAVSLIPLLAGLILIGADIAYSNQYPDEDYLPDVAEWLSYTIIGGTVPLVALLLAGGLITDESQDRTLTYMITRPIHRATLYVSKFIPVMTLAAALGALQALLFGIARVIAWAIVDPNATISDFDGGVYTVGSILAVVIPVGMLAAALAGAAYAALFGFVSLVVPRLHFLANVLIFGFWEMAFGLSGGAGFGFLTILFHAQNMVLSADPTFWHWLDFEVNPVLSGFLVAVGLVFWVALGVWRMRKQDLHVTSATT